MGEAEWGDWIEHDGQGCPVVGVLSEGQQANGRREVGIAGPDCDNPGPRRISLWRHDLTPIDMWECRVVRYRVRKPKALRDLITIAADPYAPPPVIGPDSPVLLPEWVKA